MVSVFWDARSIIFIDYLQKGETINGEYYANFSQRLSDEIKKKGPHLAKKKVLSHQDNAPVHTFVITMAKINKLKFKLLLHAPYSPIVKDLPTMKRWSLRLITISRVSKLLNIAGKSVSSQKETTLRNKGTPRNNPCF